jgi:pimeloyl-ACP methyl ester carboxylesterase
MTRRRRLLLALVPLCAVLGGVAARAVWRRWPDERVQRVPARPDAGFHSPYYMFVPDGVRTANRVRLLVLPNNTSRGAHDDLEVHASDAHRTIRHFRARAEALGVVSLVPVFPRPRTDWKVYTHALDRDVFTTTNPAYRRLDLQLLAMIDDARARLRSEVGVEVEERVLLEGFSASGMFVSRFTLLHPRRVHAAVVGAPGGWPMTPASRTTGGAALRYPMGTADLEALTGAPFDAEGARAVPMWLHLGAEDANDSVPFADGYDPEDAEVLMAIGETPVERWGGAERLFRESGFSRARFTLHDGVGHEVTPEVERELRAFLAR